MLTLIPANVLPLQPIQRMKLAQSFSYLTHKGEFLLANPGCYIATRPRSLWIYQPTEMKNLALMTDPPLRSPIKDAIDYELSQGSDVIFLSFSSEGFRILLSWNMGVNS